MEENKNPNVDETELENDVFETELEEEKELTEEEKRELYIQQLKNAVYTFKPKKHYGVEYRKKRQRKNKLTRASRKANRKK